jgi:lysozyme
VPNFSGWRDWFRLQVPAAPPAPKQNVPEPLQPIALPTEYAVSDSGLRFIKQNEGLRLAAYLDSAGIPTIGYGTIRINGAPVAMGMTCTEAEAEGWLRLECNGIARALQRILSVNQNTNQVDSLVDFCYNLGTDAFRGSSLARTINTKQPVFEDLFTRWNKIHKEGQIVEVPGLTRRRKAEYALYIS